MILITANGLTLTLRKILELYVSLWQLFLYLIELVALIRYCLDIWFLFLALIFVCLLWIENVLQFLLWVVCKESQPLYLETKVFFLIFDIIYYLVIWLKIFWYAVNYPDIRLFVKLCGCLFLCCELCSGNIGAISITSFLNSTLIKTFGDLSYENSSTVNPVQATLSSHLKISKTRGFQMMFRRNVDLK